MMRRIATLDVENLARLLFDPDAGDVTAYANWAPERFPPGLEENSPLTPCMVLKNFMRSWGHKFIYDDGTLGALLTTAGFFGVHRCKVGQRDALNLADQEMRQLVIGYATSEFETMVVEATRPA